MNAKQSSNILNIRNMEEIRSTRPARKSPQRRMPIPIKLVLGGLALAVAAGAGAFGARHFALRSSSPPGVAQLKAVESKVSRHYLLPTSEIPALATVTNKNKLSTPFLKNSQDGDEILIYQNNHIAIIYRPRIDRIVAVGPVSIDNPPAGASSSSTTNSGAGQ